MNTPGAVLPSIRFAGTPSWREREERRTHSDPDRVVEFCHPGYEYPHNILFRLSAIEPDSAPPTATQRFGVHHDTARIACAILANNAWDGYLTADKADGPRISGGPDCILVNDRYYFHPPSSQSDPKYPIVADFESWQFPHTLPPYWRSFTIPPLQPTQPQPPRRCVVSGRYMPLEAAHLVPVAQSSWFDRNSMDRFQHQIGQDNINWINQPHNKFHLTKDVHALADLGHIVFVPRPYRRDDNNYGDTGVATYPQPRADAAPDAAGSIALVSYVLKPDPFHEVVDLYHLRSLEPLQANPPEYILANFAHAIFRICIFFKNDGLQRRCIQLDTKSGNIEYSVRDNPKPPSEFKKPSRSPNKRRTASHSSQAGKRTRSSSNQDCDSEQQDILGWVASVHGEMDTGDGEDAPRGRSLKRPRRGRGVPELTRSPYSPEDDALVWGGSWTVTEERFPVVFEDEPGGLGPAASARNGKKRPRSRAPSPLRKRMRSL